MSHVFSRVLSRPKVHLILLFCVLAGLFIPGASAADEYYTGYLGDVISLSGYSYAGGDQIYLFMTGPGLPANGVTLTDVSQQAGEGQFTIVPLDNTQHWSMKWDTSRIWNQIDPGTYLVYVTTQPVDKSHLGQSSSYQTLSVYLKDAGAIAVADQSSYSLNLNDDVPVTTVTTPAVPSTTVHTPAVTSIPATLPSTTEPVVSPSAVPVTTTHAAAPVPAGIVILALCLCLCLVARR